MYAYAGALAGAITGYNAYGGIRGIIKGGRMGYNAGKARSKALSRHKRSPKKRFKPAGITGIKRKRGTVQSSRAVRRKYTRSKGSGRRSKGRSRSSAAAKTGGSHFGLGSGPRLFPGFKRTQQPTTFTSTATQRIAGASATQVVSILPTWQINSGINTEDFADRSSVWIDNKILERAERWLAAYQNSGATVLAGSTTTLRTGARATMKFVVNFLKYDQMFRNMSTQDAEITLYDCVLRNNVIPNIRGTAIDPVADWETGLTNERNPSRQTDAQLANSNALVGSPGTTPFMSTAFCKLYRIARVTKKTLSSGEVHHHTVTVKPRQMFDGQTSQQGQNDDGQNQSTVMNDRGIYLPGITGFTMLVANGSIMGRSIGGVPSGTDITLGQVAIDCVTKTTGSFASFTRERRQHLAFDGLTKGIPNAELAGPQDDAGIIQTGDPVA